VVGCEGGHHMFVSGGTGRVMMDRQQICRVQQLVASTCSRRGFAVFWPSKSWQSLMLVSTVVKQHTIPLPDQTLRSVLRHSSLFMVCTSIASYWSVLTAHCHYTVVLSMWHWMSSAVRSFAVSQMYKCTLIQYLLCTVEPAQVDSLRTKSSLST